jgi:hypothetical protein
MSDQFPVLLTPSLRREYPDCPASVPWALLAPHEARAQRNHYQSLARLASRGGLSPDEMCDVLDDRGWDGKRTTPETMRACVDRLKALVAPLVAPPARNTRYVLDCDEDGHWYVIPADKQAEAEAYFEAVTDYWNDKAEFDPGRDEPTQPAWLKPVGGSPSLVTFLEPEIT